MVLSGEPLLLSETEIDALSETVIQFHEDVIRNGLAYNPKCLFEDQHVYAEKVSSVLHGIFSSYFGEMNYSSQFEQLCVFACRLASMHIFPDGNKRTAFRMLDAQLRKQDNVNVLGDLLTDKEAEELAIQMAEADNSEKEREIIKKLNGLIH